MSSSLPPLILASASTYKKSLLSRLNLPFTTRDSTIHEVRQPGEAPASMAQRLALEKARAVASASPDAFVLGADQVIALDHTIFQKPETPEAAVNQLMMLQGKIHRLINAVCLLSPAGIAYEASTVVEMSMRPLSSTAAKAYIAQDQPLDCAGSYRIEAAGIRLFRSTRGDDPTAIEGLPLIHVWDLLLQAGYIDE